MWPKAISPQDARPLLRARRGGRCASASRAGTRSRSRAACGRRRSTRPATRCDRVPLAIDCGPLRQRQVVPHRLHLRREEHGRPPTTSPSAEQAGVQRAAQPPGRVGRAARSRTRRLPLRASAPRVIDNDGDSPTPPADGHDRGDRVQGADRRRGRDGHAADPDALAAPALPSLSDQRRASTSASTATTSPRIEYDPKKVASVLGLPRLRPVLQGQADHDDDLRLLGRPPRPPHDGTRFTLQEIFLSTLTNFLYDDGRAPEGDPSWWGLAEEALDRDLDRPHRAARDGRGHERRRRSTLPPPDGGARPPERRADRRSGCSTTVLGAVDRASASAANAAMQADRRARAGSARFLKLTETQGVYCAHPLGGCRMAESTRTSASSTTRCEAFGNEGLFCIDSLGDPDVARRQPVADDLSGVRASRGGARVARGGPRPARGAAGLSAPHAGRVRGRARGPERRLAASAVSGSSATLSSFAR